MMISPIKMAVVALALAALAACAPQPSNLTKSSLIIADTDDVDLFATRLLNGLQPQSIAESREYCGYIIRTASGDIAATPANPGGEDFCELAAPDEGTIASYHTHGSFSPRYDNEVPSVSDVLGDFGSRIDGYISTPGGRIWIVDFSERRARQVCGPRCVFSDPKDVPKAAGFVPQSFTLPQLRARFN